MRAAAPLLLVALLLPLPAAPAPGDAQLRVHVRIEGAWAQRWAGEVALGATFTVVASNSGKAHVLDARTPLGALAAAAAAGGLGLEVSDEYGEFAVLGIAGERWYATQWWDFRVDWVEPNYGAQQQWLAWGPPLGDGAEVLWYVDTFATSPLRLRALPPVAAGGCTHPLLVETLAVDVMHQPGQPWPPVTWRPAPLARLDGAVRGPVAGGLAAPGVPEPGWVWADELGLAVAPLHHLIRSPRVWVGCA